MLPIVVNIPIYVLSLHPVSAKRGMAIAYYPQQIRDSVLRPQQPDTVSTHQGQESSTLQDNEDTAVGYFISHPGDIIRIESSNIRHTPLVQAPAPPPARAIEVLLPEWNFNSNFLTNNGLTRTVSHGGFFKDGKSVTATTGTVKPDNINPHGRNIENLDWFLGIFIFITLLFVWIRLFYGKYFSLLTNALGSFHISAKLFREKNIMVRRVSIVLDFIYLVVLSVFTYELCVHFKWFTSAMSRFNQYMLLLNIIMIYSLVRVALLRFTGFLFVKYNLFAEYIHNSFVVNKGTGIVLFPVVITAHYFPFPFVSTVLISGLIILLISFILKSIRAYQIIKRKDVVLFYLILYLCTLEFLPLLLGYKVIISLI
jgi:hypothetical protein